MTILPMRSCTETILLHKRKTTFSSHSQCNQECTPIRAQIDLDPFLTGRCKTALVGAHPPLRIGLDLPKHFEDSYSTTGLYRLRFARLVTIVDTLELKQVEDMIKQIIIICTKHLCRWTTTRVYLF